MKDYFTMNIENLGPIKKADINLKNLNIIAGINGSGKSTASRLLYCFLIAGSEEGRLLANESIKERFRTFIVYWFNKLELFNLDNFDSKKLLNLANFNLDEHSFDDEMNNKIKLLKEMFISSDFPDKKILFKEFESIEKLVHSNKDFNYRFLNISNTLLKSEFSMQDFINSEDSNVFINRGDCELEYKFLKNEFEMSGDCFNHLNFANVIYIDSPSLFDIPGLINNNIVNDVPYHIVQLSKLLKTKNGIDVYDEENNKKINEFENKLTNILNGSFYFDTRFNQFNFQQDNQIYHMNNTASGIKQIGIIQLLLANRKLNKDSFLFIDEPEINLHPEWQIKLAEILVLLVKELNVYLYINSHSPQFIEALEVYSAKYGLVDDSTFYLSEKDKDNKYTFREIPRSYLFELYNNLGDPYDVLDRVRAENLSNNIY